MSSSFEETLARIASMPIVTRILEIMTRDLPENLHYHAVSHTQDVMSETIRFAVHDGVDARKVELLGIAAAYHDAGYMERYPNNEVIGAAMAADAMREAGGYSESEIEEVGKMILSTKLEPGPDGPVRICHTPLAAYLMDADWGAFGREDFFEKCQQLAEETGADPVKFQYETLSLVSNQRWLTPAARKLRDVKKQLNLAELRRRLKVTTAP